MRISSKKEAQAIAATDVKLGSLTQSRNTTIEQQPSDKEALVEVEIEGKNYFVKRADYEKLQQILSTKNYKIEGNKIYAKIGPVRMEVLLISNRPSDSQGPRNP